MSTSVRFSQGAAMRSAAMRNVATKSAAMSEGRHDGKDRKRAREGIGQTAIVVGIGAVLVLVGLFATGEYVTTRQDEPTVVIITPGVPTTGPGSAIVAAAAAGDNLIYRGSILFMPEFGHTCRQLFFNNLTGRLSDNGKVDCLAVLTEVGFAPPTQQPNARFRVISDGFRH
jgi:hypothetical protein